MAYLHLVTGYKGSPHITSANQGLLNAMILGTKDYVLAWGNQFEAMVVDANTVRINGGCLVMNGRQVTMESGSYIDVHIDNGASGMKRHDIIVVNYWSVNGVEYAELKVKKGTAVSSTPTDPTINNVMTILGGATSYDMPLYRVVLNGLTIEKVEPLFTMLAPMADMQHGFNHNLLINGDFQCNQRGQKTYDATNKSMYSLDMWRAFNVKVSVLNEGIKLAGVSTTAQGYFTQFIQLGKLNTTTYTISALVNDKICTFTVTPGGTAKDKSFDKFKIAALTTSTWDNDLGDYNNKLKINILPIGTNEVTIKYIDVFEGTVAFPHVKEDPAVAMMRCRRYVQGGACVSPVIYTYKVNDAMSYRFGITFDSMVAIPSLELCNYNYFDINELTITGTVNNTTLKNSTKNLLELVTKDDPEMNHGSNAIRVTYLLTCEPKDS